MVDEDAIQATDDPEIAGRIERALLSSLSVINRQTANRRRTFFIECCDGELAAGLTCSTAYGWLHIETLWVADDWRARGLGRKLMDAAETFGREQACHSAWLDTSSASADAFYRKLGYTAFGELANDEGRPPAEHRRWFLKSAL